MLAHSSATLSPDSVSPASSTPSPSSSFLAALQFRCDLPARLTSFCCVRTRATITITITSIISSSTSVSLRFPARLTSFCCVPTRASSMFHCSCSCDRSPVLAHSSFTLSWLRVTGTITITIIITSASRSSTMLALATNHSSVLAFVSHPESQSVSCTAICCIPSFWLSASLVLHLFGSSSFTSVGLILGCFQGFGWTVAV